MGVRTLATSSAFQMWILPCGLRGTEGAGQAGHRSRWQSLPYARRGSLPQASPEGDAFMSPVPRPCSSSFRMGDQQSYNFWVINQWLFWGVFPFPSTLEEKRRGSPLSSSLTEGLPCPHRPLRFLPLGVAVPMQSCFVRAGVCVFLSSWLQVLVFDLQSLLLDESCPTEEEWFSSGVTKKTTSQENTHRFLTWLVWLPIYYTVTGWRALLVFVLRFLCLCNLLCCSCCYVCLCLISVSSPYLQLTVSWASVRAEW